MRARPGTHAVWIGWAAIYCDLFRRVLSLCVSGHVIVGYLRLCGFNVFRNTYKPLLAETIVEFWNRYYYYFKELLVNFFFFPTFTRYFKRNPRLRMFAAVFAAAFVGNMYYHVIEDESLVRGDWQDWLRTDPACFTACCSRSAFMFPCSASSADPGPWPSTLAAPGSGHLRRVDILRFHSSLCHGDHDHSRHVSIFAWTLRARSEIVSHEFMLIELNVRKSRRAV